MKLSRILWLVTLIALLFSAVAPQAYASWQCEGRLCGTTPWQCCCYSPDLEKERDCPAEVTPQAHTTVCPSSDCGCTMALRSDDADRPTAATVHFALDFTPALLPPAPLTLGPLPTEKIARSLEARGPPGPLLALSSHRLRGPPAA